MCSIEPVRRRVSAHVRSESEKSNENDIFLHLRASFFDSIFFWVAARAHGPVAWLLVFMSPTLWHLALGRVLYFRWGLSHPNPTPRGAPAARRVCHKNTTKTHKNHCFLIKNASDFYRCFAPSAELECVRTAHPARTPLGCLSASPRGVLRVNNF